MSGSPGQTPGGPDARYEIIVHSARPRVRAAQARMRVLRRQGQSGLHRFRAYLSTPAGHRVLARSAQAAVGVAAVVGAVVMVRRWLVIAARRVGSIAGGFRAVFGSASAVGRAATNLLGMRWLGSVARWLTLGGVTGRRSCRCRDCHARVRSDASVCYRCGYRPRRGLTLGDVFVGRGVVWGPTVLTSRVLALRLHRRCPDCRRRVHADARVCGACGRRLRR